MDVDGPAAVGGEVRRSQELVVAGQHRQLDGRQRSAPPMAHPARARRDDRRDAGRCRDAMGGGNVEGADARAVADDERHDGRSGVEDGPQVRAAPRDQDPHPHANRTRASPAATATTRRCGARPRAARPGPPRPCAAGTTTVMPIPRLKVRTISSSAMSPRCWMRREDRWDRPRAGLDLDAESRRAACAARSPPSRRR